MKKFLSLLLALVLVFGLVACGQKAPEASTQTPTEAAPEATPEATPAEPAEPAEPVKITLFPLNANMMSGVVGGWAGEYLAEHGIILEVMAYSEDKLNAIIAGGDLPDIIYLPANADHKTLAESGLFLDLEQHLDKLPMLTSNESYVSAMDYVKGYVTDGSLTMLPQNVGPAGNSVTTNYAVKVNWDAYQQIGCPEVNNLDELVDVLKQMKAVYPKDANGNETYAMRMFNNFDEGQGFFYNIFNTFGVMGIGEDEIKYGIERNSVTGSYNWMCDENSAYYQSMKFFNKLYNEGLLDPNSVNIDRTTQHKTQEAGGSLATWIGVPGYEAHGYYPLYFKDYVITASDKFGGYPFGGGTYAAVSAKTENLDTVLKFLNLSADPDAVRTFNSLPQGEFWDRDSDNNLVLTDKGIAALVKGEEVFIGEEKYTFFNTPWLLHPNTKHPVDGETLSVSGSMACLELATSTDTQKAWAENYGYPNIINMLDEKNQIVEDYGALASKFAEKPSDDQNLIIAAAREIICNASWKMIYAKDEAALNEIWADMVKDLEELGFKDIYEWRVNSLNEGMAIRDSLIK